jgi:chemotaxis protein histidine kinase CheA
VLDSSHFLLLEEMIREFLKKHFDLLEIKYGERSPEKIMITDAEAAEFMQSAKNWKSLLHGQRELSGFFERMHFVPAHEALRPTAEAGRVLCKRLGKNAEISLVGASVRLDSVRLKPLLDSLINAVRNAADHGIEAPEMRVEKQEAASIVVGVFTAQDRLNFYVEDNGQGVKWDRLKEVLIAKGLCTAQNFDVISDLDRSEFLYADYVSTKDNATDISGRGFGMGALRDAARLLGGEVNFFSEKGKGTRIDIWVPEASKPLRK